MRCGGNARRFFVGAASPRHDRGSRMFIVIYAVECLRNGFTYVGLRTDHKRRWRQHRAELRKGVHNATSMLVDWRKYGESAFAVRVLEVLPFAQPRDAHKAEWRWQAHFARLGRLYNEPTCIWCRRHLEDAVGTNPDIEAPDAGRADRHAPAGHTKGPSAERTAPAEPAHAIPHSLSNR